MHFKKETMHKWLLKLLTEEDPKSDHYNISNIVNMLHGSFPKDNFHIQNMKSEIHPKWKINFIKEIFKLINLGHYNQYHIKRLLEEISNDISDDDIENARNILKNAFNSYQNTSIIKMTKFSIIEVLRILGLKIDIKDLNITGDNIIDILFKLLYEIDNLLMIEKSDRDIENLKRILKL